jgi:UDP-glucose 4-epimerase
MRYNRILLLGGGGFIGQALTRRLYSKGYIIHILTPEKINFSAPNIHVHSGKLDDRSIVEKVLPQCDIVFHLASATTPGDSTRSPVFEVEHNILPTIQFLTYLQKTDHIKNFIFISSGGAIYLPSSEKSLTENQILSPKSYYGAGKVTIESFLNVFVNIHNTNVTILRPSNLYGPGQSFRHGFGLIRTMLTHILNDTTMEIWGDGEIVRDFIYIDDMINLLELIIKTPETSGVFNVSFNKGYSIHQVKEIVEKITKKQLQVKYQPERKMDIAKVIIDSSKLKNKTGWQPVIELEKGILKTWNWLKKSRQGS